MTSEQLLIFIVGLCVTHWIGDFVLQTHWMASHKSKSNRALGAHVLVYTAVLFLGTMIILLLLPPFTARELLAFVVVNGALHFATDYLTSRWSSRLFSAWLSNTQATQHIHNFFVVIGLDQAIHYLTFLATIWLLLI